MIVLWWRGANVTDRTKNRIAAGLGVVAGLAAGFGSAAMANPNGLAELVERLGLPVALLIVVVLAMFWAGSWMAKHVLEPLVAGHLAFMERMGRATEQTSTAVQGLQVIAQGSRQDAVLHQSQERELLTSILSALKPQEKKVTPA